MRPLAAGNFDGMAYLDHIKLVGIECFAGEDIETSGSRSRCAACHPAGSAANNESYDSSGSGHRSPGPPISAVVFEHLVEFEPLGHRFFDDGAVARAHALRLFPPGCDQRGLLWVRRKP